MDQPRFRMFVETFTDQKADEIEDVLLHLLDTARNKWTEKASELLRQMKDTDLDKEALEELKNSYEFALNQSSRLCQMRYAIGKPKRSVKIRSLKGLK